MCAIVNRMAGFNGEVWSFEAKKALFDEWDPDGSGVLELSELNRLLRRGASIKLDAKLQAGAAGEIEMERSQGHAAMHALDTKPLAERRAADW